MKNPWVNSCYLTGQSLCRRLAIRQLFRPSRHSLRMRACQFDERNWPLLNKNQSYIDLLQSGLKKNLLYVNCVFIM